MYQVYNHAAFRISALSEYAASGVRLSSAVCGRSVFHDALGLETVCDLVQIYRLLFQGAYSGLSGRSFQRHPAT